MRPKARLTTSSQSVPWVCSIRRAVTSVSRPVSKRTPIPSSSRRRPSELIRLPLWARAPGPRVGWWNGMGWAFSARLAPVVE